MKLADLRRRRGPVAQDVGYGNHGDVGGDKSRFERSFDHSEIGLTCGFKRVNLNQIGQAVIGHDVDQAIRGPGRPGCEGNRLAGRVQGLCVRDCRFEDVLIRAQALRCKIPTDPGTHVKGPSGRLCRTESHDSVRRKQLVQFRRFKEEFGWREHSGRPRVAASGIKARRVIILSLRQTFG